MKGRTIVLVTITVTILLCGGRVTVAQQGAPDFILRDGKIITVDDRFSMAEAIAVSGERIVGVGSNDEMDSLAGPDTRIIDLEGRSVIPGLIDNHGHIMEEGPIWQLELRLDGIETRAEALQMIREHAISLGAGEWVFTLGGFATDQFTDDQSDFTRHELDTVAPDNP
ncbi:MAG: amidohydrolase family protein, partial [Gammaproteobacteria bacterium]|nr:amidohydrolase family protein [Gammaproteobacteria bacterium]